MGNKISSLVAALPNERSRRGHNYSGITITDQARVQNGDAYYVRNYYSGPVPSPNSLSRESWTALSFGDSAWSRKRKRATAGDDEEERFESGRRTNLDMAIDHLGGFSLSIKDQKQDKDAQRILQWIRLLLDALEDGDSMSSSQHTEDELATLQQSLLRSDRVMVNSTPLTRRKACSQVMETTRKCSIVQLGNWQIRLDTTTCRSLDGEKRPMTDSYSSLRLDASSPASTVTPSIAAFFGETTDYTQRTVMHPIILAYRTVSDDSEIFRLVERDDLNGMTRLLAEQKATVRDCDRDGRSLLHYASSYGSLECCKLLVEVGVDIDRMSCGFHGDKLDYWTALSRVVGAVIIHRSEQDLLRNMECARILIEAGADPTIRDTTRNVNTSVSAIGFVAGAIRHDQSKDYVKDAFHACFNMLLTGVLDDPRTIIAGDGLSLWLEACRGIAPAVIQKLLRSGCDASETQRDYKGIEVNKSSWKGWNGLFFAVMFCSSPNDSDDFTSVRILLNASVDPFARDDAGRTLFDHVQSPDDDLGSYRRDLWYCVLHRSGIDVRKYQEQYPRVPRYTRLYTSQHYRALCYLNDWDKDDIDCQLERILVDHPWSEEELEALNSATLETSAHERQLEETDRRQDKWVEETFEDDELDVKYAAEDIWQKWDEEKARRSEWEDHKYGSQMWFQHRTLEEYMALDREWKDEGIAWVEEQRKGESRVVEVDSGEGSIPRVLSPFNEGERNGNQRKPQKGFVDLNMRTCYRVFR